MRRIALLSLLLVAMVCAIGDAAVAAKSIRMPVNPADVGLADHSLVGTSAVITQAGTVSATFSADGSVLLELPTAAYGADSFAAIGVAVGTWAPLGPRGAAFTAVQTISHANADHYGTITIDGSLTMRDDPALTEVVVSFDRVTIRDGRTNRVALASSGGVTTGAPVEAGTVEARFIAADLASGPVRFGGGCNTCR